MSAQDADAERRQRGGTPVWVKVFVVVAAVAAVLFVVSLLVGGGHGPGRHVPGAGEPATGESTDHTPPVGGHG